MTEENGNEAGPIHSRKGSQCQKEKLSSVQHLDVGKRKWGELEYCIYDGDILVRVEPADGRGER